MNCRLALGAIREVAADCPGANTHEPTKNVAPLAIPIRNRGPGCLLRYQQF